MVNSYKLVLQSGPNAGTEFPLEKDELYLGRDVNNDITINDAEVSRRHARFSRQGENYIYEDLGSTNGSFILGQRVAAPTLLLPGTTITIGERVLINFKVESTDASATVVVARPRQVAPVVPPTPVAPPASVVPPPAAYPPPAYQPPAYTPPVNPPPPGVPAPVYSPQRPTYMVPPPPATPRAEPKKTSKGLVILLVIVGIILVFCVIPWIIVEVTNSYCSLFPGIFNAIQPGSCF
ncbi:MAG: FHA domain-containing protein [Anaerolineaceae bacterium]